MNFKFTPEIGSQSYLVVFADFANEVAERLIHVDALLGGSLDELAPQVFGKVAALCATVAAVRKSSPQR